MTNMEGSGRTALITGASAGIGTALAHVFAENGFGLVLTARREDRLKAVAEELARKYRVATVTIAADLADPAAPERIFEETERRTIRIDALVNNAGYGVPNYFRNKPWAVHAEFLQVMVTAVAHLTHLYEPGMTERKYGRIMNVSSLAALTPGAAGHTLYAAAKSFLVKFSESLALEHLGGNVHATAVCPGFTYSEFHDVVGNRALVSKLPSYLWMDAEKVARGSYAAVMRGDAVFVPGIVNQAIASAMKLVPEPIALAMIGRQTKRYRVGD
jgi:short-subunit dehydrogenase